jgi:hypothetical protein
MIQIGYEIIVDYKDEFDMPDTDLMTDADVSLLS